MHFVSDNLIRFGFGVDVFGVEVAEAGADME